MIGFEEAFLVFGKWAEECTRIRLDSKLSSCRFSCEGTLEPVPFPMIRLRLDSSGFIDIYLPENTHFDYCDPDSMRVDLADRISQTHTGKLVRHGAVICAVRGNNEEFLFVEVIAEA